MKFAVKITINLFLIVIYLQKLVAQYNREMKRTTKVFVRSQKQNSESDVDMDCSCQILLDTSLSNVGDSQCDCSDCLEANLNAFNQFKNQQSRTHDTTKQNIPNNRGKQTHSANKTKKQQDSQIHRYKSNDRFVHDDKKTRKKWGVPAQNEEREGSQYNEFQQGNQYTNGQLNDFLLITKHRTRKYLEERKKLQADQKLGKDILKQKIKKNLQILKYTTEMINQHQPRIGNQSIEHPYKWNHSQYLCECNGKQNKNKPNHDCCRKIKVKSQLDTNLFTIKDKSDKQRRDNLLEQKKQQRQQRIKNYQKEKCPHDNCKNHHCKTDPSKIKQIQKFIEKNVKKYQDDQKAKKKKQEQAQRVKQAKLRAIDLKSRQKLQKSKKFDDNISRTSFKMSIDQFDTFSELRQQNQRRKQVRQNQRQIKNNIKNGGGALENRIYQQLEDQEEDDHGITQYQNKNKHPAQKVKYSSNGIDIKSQLNKINKKGPKIIAQKTKGDAPQLRDDELIYDRIAYDANIKAPKNMKHNAESKKTQQKSPIKSSNVKLTQRQSQLNEKKTKNLSKGKQQQKRKKLQQEIQKKKKEILEQYKKRNLNKPSNKQIRKQYEQKISRNDKQKINNVRVRAEKDQPLKDPYRNTYQTKAGKNQYQVEVHGDPLLQQYDYHKGYQKAKRPRGQDTGIFTENIYSLSGKSKLKA